MWSQWPNWCLKQVLGVKKSHVKTCAMWNQDICFSFITMRSKQHNLSVHRRWQERPQMADDSLMYALKYLTINTQTGTNRMTNDIITHNEPELSSAIENVKENITNSISSRFAVPILVYCVAFLTLYCCVKRAASLYNYFICLVINMNTCNSS